MKLHSGGTSTTLTSIARASASSNTRMLRSVSSVAAIAIRQPSRSPAGVLAALPPDRALERQLDELRMGLGGDQRHVGVAREQALDLLEPDVAAADDHAAPAGQPQARDVERRLQHPLHARLVARALAELADALLAGVGLGRHVYEGTAGRTLALRLRICQLGSPNRFAGRRRYRVNASRARRAPEPRQRRGPVPQRAPARRQRAVQQVRGLAQRLAERLVVRVPPRVADRRALPHAQLDVDALVQPELRVGAAEAGVLDAAPRALAGAVAEHVVVDPHHPGLELAPRSARPRARSDVHTDAPSPNSESLASATASSSESTTMIGSTGPKISSRMIRISCVTPVSTAGA